MSRQSIHSFAIRLRDVLSTLEAAAVLSAEDGRRRGLAAQLVYACMSLPCDEALVALELRSLGRLVVPGVATADGWTAADHELLPSGTPFAYLLGGGGGFAAEIAEDDAMMSSVGALLQSEPRHAIFVPVRVGGSVVGGAALLNAAPFAEGALDMAERLADVLSLTLEAHRTERALVQVFATVLPDLLDDDAPTDFAERLDDLVNRVRLDPMYQRRLELAHAVGRVAGRGDEEARLAGDVLASVDRYISALDGTDDEGGAADVLADDLYDE